MLKGLLNAVGVGVYVFFVSLIMRNGEQIFGKMDKLLGPVAFLMLFVLSAAITGSLVLGQPILLYVENRKTEAVKLFLFTLASLFIIIFGIFIVLAVQH